ncbi:MAG TPA: alpha/beta hydrolase [Candidatus Binataceae bacterium]|jgi:acetyl esterase/lipase|nr:alpha/beta hydrolase [Candidatus Binataceae bacterium]
MASPQLQMAIDAMKALATNPSPTLPEMRAAFEQNAIPAQPDVKAERISAGGVDAEWITAPGAAADRVVLYLHGGGYVLGSVKTHRDLIGRISRAAQARVLALNYRLGPEHPFPAAVDDALAGYRYLLENKVQPSRIVVAGDSAGGGLTIAALIAIRDAGLRVPAAGVCLSPWVDMEGKGESMTTRAKADPVVQREGLVGMAQAYLGGKDPRTPLASPIHADLKGLPPLLIQVGDAETLLDDSTRIADKARAAGVQVKLEVWPEMIHVWQMFASFLPEGQEAVDGIGK